MYYNEEIIRRYESLFKKFNDFFQKPIQISNLHIKLFFLKENYCIEFLKNFLKDFHLCRLSDDNKEIEIKILNLYNFESLLKTLLHNLQLSLHTDVITINRNCYYARNY